MPKKKKGFGIVDGIAIGIGAGASTNKGLKKLMKPTNPGGWGKKVRNRKGIFK